MFPHGEIKWLAIERSLPYASFKPTFPSFASVGNSTEGNKGSEVCVRFFPT
jgi:hypothetical protein